VENLPHREPLSTPDFGQNQIQSARHPLRRIFVVKESETGKLLPMNPHLARLMHGLLFVGLLLPAPKSAAAGPSPKIKLLIVEVSNCGGPCRLRLRPQR